MDKKQKTIMSLRLATWRQKQIAGEIERLRHEQEEVADYIRCLIDEAEQEGLTAAMIQEIMDGRQ